MKLTLREKAALRLMLGAAVAWEESYISSLGKSDRPEHVYRRRLIGRYRRVVNKLAARTED